MKYSICIVLNEIHYKNVDKGKETKRTTLIENYFSASPYPTAVGYAYSDDGKVMPIFPKGEQFCETEITKANCEAVALLTKWVYEFGFSAGQLRQWAMEQLSKLRGCDVHSSVILSSVDENVFKRLGVNLTCQPKYKV